MSEAAIKKTPSATAAFDYELPRELIAQHPLPDRASSRLLSVDGDSGALRDLQFARVTELLRAGDVLVFNDTRVIPARLLGRKSTGGQVELLVDRIEDDHTVLAMAGSSKPLRSGQLLRLEKDGDACRGLVLERTGDRVLVRFSRRVEHVLDRLGHVPLPPYIERPDVERDRERYQTVYARSPGAVAAPTAGLHFDQALMDGLRRLGVRCVFLTLHVGAGTFQPVRARDPQDHRMHAEWIRVPSDVCAAVAEAKRCGNRVVAVGTTSVRALETLALRGGDAPYEGYTDLFLYPGKKFKTVDALITNFHLPRSSLLMLICAFAGTENTLHAYRHAVRSRYRFYSYGDAMFVTPQPEAVAC